MQGSIKTIRDGVHRLRFDVGLDPRTHRRRQQMFTFKGTRQAAERRLREMLKTFDDGNYVEPSKLTLGSWLIEWIEGPARQTAREATYTRYKGIIEQTLLKAPIASIPLQKLRAVHLEAYYAEVAPRFAPATLTLHHAILHRALQKAARDQLISANPARDLEGRPRRRRCKSEDARNHCWNVEEVKQFLTKARAAGPQPAAFYTLAIDSGMRKGELCGLGWDEVDLDARRIHVVRQLRSPKLNPDGQPLFGPTKTGKVRSIAIAPETVEFLRVHRAAQLEKMMLRRTTYHRFGLVFARDEGRPLLMNNLGQREYAALIQAAGVKRIKFHGMRHTCATLLLKARQPVHVVSERLGHATASMTLEVYAHVLPDMQDDAATALQGLLYGRP